MITWFYIRTRTLGFRARPQVLTSEGRLQAAVIVRAVLQVAIRPEAETERDRDSNARGGVLTSGYVTTRSRIWH